MIGDFDFDVICFNSSMFLVMMSLLRNCSSINMQIRPMIIINKEYYDLFNFKNPQIKFLWISWYDSNLYPVNNFWDDCWSFNWSWEDSKENWEFTPSAYAVFKFLVNSNFIYSLKEIKINWCSFQENFSKDLNELLRIF